MNTIHSLGRCLNSDALILVESLDDLAWGWLRDASRLKLGITVVEGQFVERLQVLMGSGLLIEVAIQYVNRLLVFCCKTGCEDSSRWSPHASSVWLMPSGLGLPPVTLERQGTPANFREYTRCICGCTPMHGDQNLSDLHSSPSATNALCRHLALAVSSEWRGLAGNCRPTTVSLGPFDHKQQDCY